MSELDPNIRWIVAQEGTRQTYGVPLSFQKCGSLRLLCTDLWCRYGRAALRHGTAGARAFATHYDPGIPSEKVVSFNSRAVLWRAWYHFHRASMSPDELAEVWIRYGHWFACRVRDEISRLRLDPKRDVYFGFNTNCLETLGPLKEQGILTVVDQTDPARVEEEMILEEARRWAGWEKIPGRLPEAYWQRLQAEWDLADIILVNSEWSSDALVKQGVEAKRIIIVPLAIDLPPKPMHQPVNPAGRLKVIWLGSVILRKGIQYLVEAARLLERENIEFLLAGPVGISPQVVANFPANMKMLGRVTRDQLTEVYQQGHVFVLPTVSDGFAITQLEAMAHGLPVVTTSNCGRVVTDGLDGLIVPARDSVALAAALARLNADRKLLLAMSRHALETIQQYDLRSNGKLMESEVKQFRNKLRCDEQLGKKCGGQLSPASTTAEVS